MLVKEAHVVLIKEGISFRLVMVKEAPVVLVRKRRLFLAGFGDSSPDLLLLNQSCVDQRGVLVLTSVGEKGV